MRFLFEIISDREANQRAEVRFNKIENIPVTFITILGKIPDRYAAIHNSEGASRGSNR
jgi:hypothetical protein